MPELPEVETIVRDLNKTLKGKTFAGVVVHDSFVLRCNKSRFIKRLLGQRIEGIYRRGKAIIISLESKEMLVIQLMMTGQLISKLVSLRGAKRRSNLLKRLPRSLRSLAMTRTNPHTRITFLFSDGSGLLYNDQRRFGQLRVVKDLKEVKYFNILGPEPLSRDFSRAFMHKAFKKTARPIKSVLLDHTVVAGIGNIYACEILFRAGISPKSPACRINTAGIDALYQNSVEVLKEAIHYRGSSMRNYRDGSGKEGSFHKRLAVYAREGLPCPRCQSLIKRLAQSARSTFYCTRCQK